MQRVVIPFENWSIAPPEGAQLWQYDHLAQRLEVAGALPEGYEWYLDVLCRGQRNAIALEKTQQGAWTAMTAEMLAEEGWYALQLRGVRGETVRHSNVVRVLVHRSIGPGAPWPELPHVLQQLEARVRETAEQVRQAALHPQKVGENGNWWGWDPASGAYTDTGIPAGAGGVTRIYAAGDPLPVVDQAVALPLADGNQAGLVRSGTGENQVAVNADGFMEVVGLNVDRLAQTPGKRLILACGSSREEADEK